jgi:hypothetical protein
MDIGWNEIVGAIVGAGVTWLLDSARELFLRRKRPLPPGGMPPGPAFLRWWLLGRLRLILIGAGVGALAGFLIVWMFQRTISTFAESEDGWVRNFEARDASTKAVWDSREEALRSEFDFAQFGSVTGEEEPRATFSTDNLLGTSASRWSEYRLLNVKVTNLTSHPLEMTFSVFKEGCFYEFGDYQNLPPFETRTLTYDFLAPHYKTCEFPLSFRNPLGAADGIQRLDLILGVNVSSEEVSGIKGAILIESVWLERDVRWLLFWLGVVVLGLGASAIYILRRNYPGQLEEGVLA